jgi:hypothetical protein
MELYDKVVEYVDDSFGGKKPHFERAVYWIEKFIPNAKEAHKISAYAHDIERGLNGEKGRDYLNREFYIAHSEKGAEIMGEFLEKNGSVRKIKIDKLGTVEKTKTLIDQKISLEKIAKARGLKIDSIIDHIEKLLEEKVDLDIGYLKEEMISKIIEKRSIKYIPAVTIVAA